MASFTHWCIVKCVCACVCSVDTDVAVRTGRVDVALVSSHCQRSDWLVVSLCHSHMTNNIPLLCSSNSTTRNNHSALPALIDNQSLHIHTHTCTHVLTNHVLWGNVIVGQRHQY